MQHFNIARKMIVMPSNILHSLEGTGREINDSSYRNFFLIISWSTDRAFGEVPPRPKFDSSSIRKPNLIWHASSAWLLLLRFRASLVICSLYFSESCHILKFTTLTSLFSQLFRRMVEIEWNKRFDSSLLRCEYSQHILCRCSHQKPSNQCCFGLFQPGTIRYGTNF